MFATFFWINYYALGYVEILRKNKAISLDFSSSYYIHAISCYDSSSENTWDKDMIYGCNLYRIYFTSKFWDNGHVILVTFTGHDWQNGLDLCPLTIGLSTYNIK